MDVETALHLHAQRVSADLAEAIRCYEVYAPTGKKKPLIRNVNALGVNGTFNVISHTLLLNIIIVLGRIWEISPKVSSIEALRQKMIKVPRLRGHELRCWEKQVEAVRDSDELEAVITARNMFVAHTASPEKTYKGKARAVAHGDERVVIERSIRIVHSANQIIHHGGVNFAGMQQVWAADAERFWGRFLEPQKEQQAP